MPRLRRVACMCSSTLSVNCEQVTKDTEEKILCRSPISERSHIGNLRQIRKQGKGRSPKRKGNRRCPFLFAPAAGRGTFPPSADGESLAEVQRKTLPPVRGEPACGSSRTPFNRCRERSRPVRANPPAAVRAPRSDGAEKFFRKFSKKLTIHGQFSPPSGIGLKEVTQ